MVVTTSPVTSGGDRARSPPIAPDRGRRPGRDVPWQSVYHELVGIAPSTTEMMMMAADVITPEATSRRNVWIAEQARMPV